jgi:hypothetical protein
MSNRLHNQAKRITSLAGRRIHPSEKAVLLALADDARDHLGGRSKLTAKQISEITGFSRRAVGMAISALADAGHISREAIQPGAPLITLVHPGEAPAQAVARVAEIAKGRAAIANPVSSHCQGSYREENNYQSTEPRDHGTCERAREPAALDEVDQVFAAWDAWLERCGLPGPVTRVPVRRAAIAAQLAQFGLGRLLMAIDRAERGYRAGKFNRAGQGDLWFTFDKVFEVGGARGFNLLARLLDGWEFGSVPAAAGGHGQGGAAGEGAGAPADPAVPPDVPADAPAWERDLRARLAAALGAQAYAAWIAPVRLCRDADGGLIVAAPSAFDADWIGQHYRTAIDRAHGGRCIIRARERVSS